MAENTVFDTSDIDRWIGVPIGGGGIIEDIHINDIRRWRGPCGIQPAA